MKSTNLFLSLLCLFFSFRLGTSSLYKFLRHYEQVHYDTGHLLYHHNRVQRSIIGPREIELKLEAYGKKFDLRLYPDDSYLHKNLRIIKNNVPYSTGSLKSILYSGYDINDPSAVVTGHLAFGIFDGIIRTPEDIYYIEPSSRYLNETESIAHTIVYRQSDVDMSILNVKGMTPCGDTTPLQHQNMLFLQKQQGNLRRGSFPRLQKRQSGTRNTSLTRCTLKIIADFKFYTAVTSSGESESTRTNQAIALLRNIVSAGSNIFQSTDFDNNGAADDIHFVVLEFVVNTSAPASNSPFANDFLGVEAFLTHHSQADYDAFCLSYLFTYRDFNGGVLGLAYVASEGGRGGICDSYSGTNTLNTGIVTLLNFGSRVPLGTSKLTFTHEAGHNFGSLHDPPSDPACSPTEAQGGKFIMAASASNGQSPNNQLFSSCSIAYMRPIVTGRGQIAGCFLSSEDNCRNQLIDPGEDCDCGRSFDTSTGLCNTDPCCNGTTCRLANTATCSPQQGVCCDSTTCSFIPQSQEHLCSAETECALNQTCNGTSAQCPTAQPKTPTGNETAIACNGGSSFCTNGICEGSICIPLGLADCECTSPMYSCHVCCMLNSACNSTLSIAANNETARNLLPNMQGQVLLVGFPCNNFSGYCDFFNVCQPVQSDSALNRITNFFSSPEVQNFINLVVQYWWAAVIIGVVIIAAMFAFVLICHCLLPRPEHMKKRAERRKTIRRSMRRPRVNVNEQQDFLMEGGGVAYTAYPQGNSQGYPQGYAQGYPQEYVQGYPQGYY